MKKDKSFFNKIFFISIILVLILSANTLYPVDNAGKEKTALIIIDVQYFYFPGGALPLNNPEQTAKNIKKVLTKFRSDKKLVIHIRHNSKKGGEIYKLLAPESKEKVISKNFANSFKDTDLLSYLEENGISKIVVTGMQTHMCVEAAVRAAADYGFKCIVISDGCTTRDLKFNGNIIKSGDVHDSTLSTLSGTYAEISDTKNFLKKKQAKSIQD